MRQREVVALVCGYGCNRGRLKGYLNFVWSSISRGESKEYHVKYAVLSGGETNRATAPGKTEAEIMESALCAISAELYRDSGYGLPEFVLETGSRSSRESLEKFRSFFFYDDLPDVVIFCDRAHVLKVRLLARFILGRWVRVKSYPVIPGMREYFKQLVGTAVSVTGLFVPAVARWELRRRLRVIEQS